MRIVVIDPYTKTVTEDKLPPTASSRAICGRTVIKQALKHAPNDLIVMVTPVRNDATGDMLYANRSPASDAPAFKFLGETYHGRALIAGRGNGSVDAAVPLARVQKQVSF